MNTEKETGFGSPSITSTIAQNQSVFDSGYGDPTWNDIDLPATGVSTGWGSPFTSNDAQAYLLGAREYGNDGGAMISIFGLWGAIFDSKPNTFAGPFIVSLINRSTLEETKCYSALPTLKYLTYSDISQRVIKVSLPPLPLGAYDIKVSWGTDFAVNAIIEDALDIIKTNRCQAEYSIARSLPGYMAVRKNYTDSLPESFDDLKPLQCLVSAIGEEIQSLSGSGAFTLLIEELELSSNTALLETTLGLPSSGEVYIGNQLFSYTSKDEETLFGLECRELIREVQAINSKVSLKIN